MTVCSQSATLTKRPKPTATADTRNATNKKITIQAGGMCSKAHTQPASTGQAAANSAAFRRHQAAIPNPSMRPTLP